MKIHYVLKRIYPSGSTLIISTFSESEVENAKAEARARHQNEKKKGFTVVRITEETVHQIAPEF